MTLLECFQPLMAAVRQLTEMDPSKLDVSSQSNVTLNSTSASLPFAESHQEPALEPSWKHTLETLRLDAESAIFQLGLAKQLVDEARFAVYVWVDEAILSSPISSQGVWHPWQWHFFQTHIGGEEFFERLNHHSGATKNENQTQLLSVYAFCLGMGFCGKYAHFHNSDLQRIRRSLSEKLLAEKSILPFEHEAAKPTPIQKMMRRSPAWRLIDPFRLGLIVVALGLTTSVYFLYQTLLNAQLMGWIG
ncbi:DotU family type IV/VI secretion system protein [Vibrio sp. S4M6]|uniref:DotU family type IV/VI secretion system protein n=1 Tax=Vibrio sinus TaxID=2946865 RepID=UPI00202A396A|nr:DotU family type IV/VI secretion system protein [Vibrio sinus]MCL9782512.1 DotU family type IV/VI secretion system protein [Vibrio sinus]